MCKNCSLIITWPRGFVTLIQRTYPTPCKVGKCATWWVPFLSLLSQQRATLSPGLFPQKMGGAHPFFEGKALGTRLSNGVPVSVVFLVWGGVNWNVNNGARLKRTLREHSIVSLLRRLLEKTRLWQSGLKHFEIGIWRSGVQASYVAFFS